MTTTLTSDEREERLKYVRERLDEFKKMTFHGPVPLATTMRIVGYADELLSLLDSQAADGDISHCALCEDPSFIYRDCVTAAATQMRDKCIEKVKKRADEFARGNGDNSITALEADLAKAKVCETIITDLQSLTLDTEKAQ